MCVRARVCVCVYLCHTSRAYWRRGRHVDALPPIGSKGGGQSGGRRTEIGCVGVCERVYGGCDCVGVGVGVWFCVYGCIRVQAYARAVCVCACLGAGVCVRAGGYECVYSSV